VTARFTSTSPASEVHRERFAETEITRREDETEGRAIRNFPAAAPRPSDSPVASTRSGRFQLFRFLKKQLADKRFAIDVDVKQAVTSWPQTLKTNLFYAGIKALVTWYNSCLNVSGDHLVV